MHPLTPQPVAPPVAFAVSIRLGDLIDHTLLRGDATAVEIDTLGAEAVAHRLYAVCVGPQWVERVRAAVVGSPVRVATVVDFPDGRLATAERVAAADRAVQAGADELDLVVQRDAVSDAAARSDWRAVAADLAAVVAAAGPGVLVKVILESAALAPAVLVQACRVVRDAGAGYVKTSTGYHAAGGATTAAVALMRLAVGDRLGVKASGGIRNAATAFAMIASGATRIGTSAGVALADAVGPGPRPVAALFGTETA